MVTIAYALVVSQEKTVRQKQMSVKAIHAKMEAVAKTWWMDSVACVYRASQESSVRWGQLVTLLQYFSWIEFWKETYIWV